MKLWRASRDSAQERFDRDLLPYLDSAYNLAKWITKNDDDASDVVQESFLRAFKKMGQFGGENPKPWLLAIVRNTSLSLLAKRPDCTLSDEAAASLRSDGPSPEEALLRNEAMSTVARILEELPTEFREVIVLRDLEDLSYKEIAQVVGVPIGTVMSRISRGRERIKERHAGIEREQAYEL